MVKILQVSPHLAYPPTAGGHWRIHGLVSGGELGDEIYRFSQAPVSNVERAPSTNPYQIKNNYSEYRYSSYLYSALCKYIPGPPLHASNFLSLVKPKVLIKRIKWADVCLVEFPWQFEFVLNCSDTDTPVVYSSHNFEPDYHEAEIGESAISDQVMNKIWESEKRAALNSDLIITCTNKDASKYQKEFHSDLQVVTIPNAAMAPSDSELFDAKKRESPIDKDISIAAVFIGSDTIHNRSAVDNILAISAQSSIRELDIHFYIGGSVCENFRQKQNRENVDFLGYVDDLSSLYTDADLGLNPITSGSGSNVKIPDYMAHGLPVLTTPFGSRGVQLTDRSEGWIVDLVNFKDKLIELSSYPDCSFNNKSKNARKLALNKLSWSVASKKLLNILKSL